MKNSFINYFLDLDGITDIKLTIDPIDIELTPIPDLDIEPIYLEIKPINLELLPIELDFTDIEL